MSNFVISVVRFGGHFNAKMLSNQNFHYHYNDVIMGMIGSQITSLAIVYSSVYSGADQRKHQYSSLYIEVYWNIYTYIKYKAYINMASAL